MATRILACTNLLGALEKAQQKMNTNYPIIQVDRTYHREPKEMRQHLLSLLADLPPDTDTLLVAMGFCGGSWQDVVCPCRMVLPRVDDCVSLMLTTDDTPCSDLKQLGHMYVTGGDSSITVGAIYRDLMEQYGDEDMAAAVFGMWFEHYHHVDIVDTGLYDCYEEEFVLAMQRDADLIHSELDFVPGSNLLLEKLVGGIWDGQFLVAEAGTNLTQSKILVLT